MADERAWMPSASSGTGGSGGAPAETLEGYEDLTEVARGGDSIVYRARQVRLGRDVAVKVLLVDDAEALRRFERELDITVRLGRQHPHIVTVLDTGTTGSGRPGLVMDFFEEGSLADRLTRQGPSSVSEAVAVGTVVADALAFAHDRGVLHRDVKPQNVLLLPTSYVLTDFGVARLADSEHTASADRFSYRHASPQMLDGLPATASDDVWSVGSMLFTLLDGRPPFASDEPGDDTALAYLRRVRTEEPRVLERADVPDQLRDVVVRCLEKDPGLRWESAAALKDALSGVPTQARTWDPDRPADAPAPLVDLPPVAEPVPPAVSVWAPPAELPDVPPPAPKRPPVPETGAAAAQVASEPSATTPDRTPDAAAHAASALVHAAPAGPTADGDATGVAPRAAVEMPELEEPPPPRRAKRVGLFIGIALLLGVAIGGLGYVINGRDAEPTATPDPRASTAAPIVPVDTATAAPSPDGPVVTDPELSPVIDDLRSRGSSIAIHWTDPSDGKATFLVVRSDKAGAKWTGEMTGNGTGEGGGAGGTLEAWGPDSARPCFVVVALMGDRRGVSRPRCLTMG